MQNGFLLINKPAGPTSHDIVDELRRITGPVRSRPANPVRGDISDASNGARCAATTALGRSASNGAGERKIGHAGTLDPFASGLLIVAVGREATRNIAQFVKQDKVYIAKLHLGETSNTYDRTGDISEISNFKFQISKEDIEKILKKFVGEQTQIPPMYSAKKVGGKKLYELARKGIEIERKPAEIKIEYIKLLKFEYPELEIETRVSSGTYIRTLAHDIGQTLGCGAYLEELTRTEIGGYKLKDAVEIKNLTKETWPEFIIDKK